MSLAVTAEQKIFNKFFARANRKGLSRLMCVANYIKEGFSKDDMTPKTT